MAIDVLHEVDTFRLAALQLPVAASNGRGCLSDGQSRVGHGAAYTLR